MRFTPSTLIVRFLPEATSITIFDLLDKYNLNGMKVSDLVNRWAVEVPYGREQKYATILESSEMVAKVYDGELKGHQIRDRRRQRRTEWTG